MIIDLILDRQDDNTVWSDSLGQPVPYNAHTFYLNVMDYGEIGYDITRAFDEGTEQDIKKALCDYIDNGNYSEDIKEYINSVEWLVE